MRGVGPASAEGGTGIDERTADPSGSDTFDRPSSARVYDFLLGGTAHGAADRELARSLIAAEPLVVSMARENRAFLRRAVTVLAEAGIDQFLDLGSGIPTMGSTHEVARRVNPHARVAYVDIDPVAVAHGAVLLGRDDGLAVSCRDLRRPEAVLEAPGVTEVIDLSRPLGVLMVSVLHHVPDEGDPAGLVTRYLERTVPGSALALSHLSGDDPRVDVSTLRLLTAAYPGGGITPRSRERLAAFLADVELLDPGLVYAAEWRPEIRRERRRALPDACCGHRAAVGFVRH